MKKIYLFLISSLTLFSCSKEDYTKTENESEIYVRVESVSDSDTTYSQIELIKLK